MANAFGDFVKGRRQALEAQRRRQQIRQTYLKAGGFPAVAQGLSSYRSYGQDVDPLA